jgi:hypothetical protein
VTAQNLAESIAALKRQSATERDRLDAELAAATSDEQREEIQAQKDVILPGLRKEWIRLECQLEHQQRFGAS